MADPERWCRCQCHRHLYAEHRAHLQHDEAGFHVYRAAQDARHDAPWTATDDVVEAALACRVCQNRHCPALCSTRPTPVIRRLLPPFPPIPHNDATAYTDPEQGDSSGDQGEGKED